MSAVTFVCQHCKQPLRIHNSLTDISPAAFDLLSGETVLLSTNKAGGSNKTSRKSPLTPTRPAQYPTERTEVYEKALRQDSKPIAKRVIPASKNGSPSYQTSLPTNPKSNESFVVLTQSQINKSSKSPNQLSPRGKSVVDSDFKRRKLVTKLFDAISGNSDIDYPMCTECAETLLEILSAKHVEVTKERDTYLEFIKGLQNEGQVTPEEKAAAEKELEEVTLIIVFS